MMGPTALSFGAKLNSSTSRTHGSLFDWFMAWGFVFFSCFLMIPSLCGLSSLRISFVLPLIGDGFLLEQPLPVCHYALPQRDELILPLVQNSMPLVSSP